MPRRWGTKTRLWAYRYLVLRDGEFCQICGKIPTARNTLDIDHLDGKPRNNETDNLRLLCRSCNTALGNKTRSPTPSAKCVCVREREKMEGKSATRIIKIDADYRQGSPEMKSNLLCEVSFRRWILSEVCSQGGYLKTDAIKEGAELVGCSPVTTARYLEKLISKAGPLSEQMDALGYKILVLRSKYE